MTAFRIRLGVAFASVVLALSANASALTPLKDGDRVVFYGDSITEQRLYTRYLQQFITVRYPSLDVRFYNAGWGGDSAPGALKRLERDVLTLKPTVVTLFFGMNDGRYKKLEQSTLDDYRAGMKGLIERLKTENIRVIVYTPGIVDYDKNDNVRNSDYNATLKALGDVCRELGKQYDVEVIDVHAPMLAFQLAQKERDKNFTMIPDSVHPNAMGHLVMAGAMLPALAEPVAAIGEVDVAKLANTETLSINKVDDGWQISAKLATPFWIEPDSRPFAFGVAPYVLPKLVVKSLPAGNYVVEVGNFAPVTLTADQLMAGVPIGASDDAGKALHDLIRFKEDNYFNAWRNLRLPLGKAQGVDAVYQSELATDEKLVAVIRNVVRSHEQVEIRIQPAPVGENLALRKPYEVSDPNPFGWGIGGLTDGSWEPTASHCFATGAKNEFPKTVTVDLQQTKPLAQIILGVPPFGSTKTVIVSLSGDGQTFNEVGQTVFEQGNAARKAIRFESTPARYVRLTYPDHHADEVVHSPFFSFTSELEAYEK